MKSINEFAVERQWELYGFYGACAIILLLVILSWVRYFNNLVVFGLSTLALAWLGFCYRMASRRDKECMATYRTYLAKFSLQTLIVGTSSPELDDKSKHEIIEFLNTNHKGWSFPS